MQSNTKDLMIMIILSSFILSLKQHIAKHLNKVNTDLSRIAPCPKKGREACLVAFFRIWKSLRLFDVMSSSFHDKGKVRLV